MSTSKLSVRPFLRPQNMALTQPLSVCSLPIDGDMTSSRYNNTFQHNTAQPPIRVEHTGKGLACSLDCATFPAILLSQGKCWCFAFSDVGRVCARVPLARFHQRGII